MAAAARRFMANLRSDRNLFGGKLARLLVFHFEYGVTQMALPMASSSHPSPAS